MSWERLWDSPSEGLQASPEEESVLEQLGVEGHKAARDGLLEMRMLEWLQSRDPPKSFHGGHIRGF